MTPRELKDMPWLLTAFAVVILIIVGGHFQLALSVAYFESASGLFGQSGF